MEKVFVTLLFLMLQSCASLSGDKSIDFNDMPRKKTMTPSLSHDSQDYPRPQKKAVKHLTKKSTDFLDHGHLEKAISSLERAYRIDSRDPEVSYLMAKALYAKGEDRQSEQWALKSLNLWHRTQRSQKRKAWELVSRCRLRDGNFEGANEAIERSRSL